MNEPQAARTPGIAVAALILSLLFCVPFAPIVGLILGIVALSQISKSNGRLGGQGMALAAVIIGAFMLIANIGVLAAIAIPNFIRYQNLSKQAEVRLQMGALKIGAQSYALRVESEDGKPHFPAGSTGWVPAGPCGSDGCKGDTSAFNQPPWSDLAFTPPPRLRYQYRYQSTDPEHKTFEAEAQADLDGDGKFSKWKLTGTIGADGNVEVGEPENETPGTF